jgi:hypothetical protein
MALKVPMDWLRSQVCGGLAVQSAQFDALLSEDDSKAKIMAFLSSGTFARRTNPLTTLRTLEAGNRRARTLPV